MIQTVLNYGTIYYSPTTKDSFFLHACKCKKYVKRYR